MYDSEISFPEALKLIIRGGNPSFPMLLMGLNRQGVLAGYSPLQYMLQALAPSGYYRPLMAAMDMAEVERLSAQFAGLTGFRRRLTDYLFRSFAYALELTDVCPQVPSSDDSGTTEEDAEGVAEPHAEYGAQNRENGAVAEVAQWNPRWSIGEKTRFLTSLINVNRENERRLGMTVSVPSCSSVGSYDFRLTAELRRSEPRATGALFYAVYDRDGRLLVTEPLGVMCFDDVSVLPRQQTVAIEPSRVGRIELYWDS